MFTCLKNDAFVDHQRPIKLGVLNRDENYSASPANRRISCASLVMGNADENSRNAPQGENRQANDLCKTNLPSLWVPSHIPTITASLERLVPRPGASVVANDAK